MSIHDRIAEDVTADGCGFLRCESCGVVDNITQRGVSYYLRKGWPRCCGYTMRWWTARQVAADEVPEFGVVPS